MKSVKKELTLKNLTSIVNTNSKALWERISNPSTSVRTIPYTHLFKYISKEILDLHVRHPLGTIFKRNDQR